MKKPIPFSRLSKLKQRIEIAKDTIKWVLAGTFKPKKGWYVSVNLPKSIEEKFNNDDPETCNLEVNKLLQENKKVTCSVCAKGGMFMAHVMKENNYSLQDSVEKDDDETMKQRLKKFFSLEQLDLIETAFEKQYRFYEDHIPYHNTAAYYLDNKEKEERRIAKERARAAIEFGRKYKDSSKRMIAIMENLIKNKGEFKP